MSVFNKTNDVLIVGTFKNVFQGRDWTGVHSVRCFLNNLFSFSFSAENVKPVFGRSLIDIDILD